MGRSGVDTVAIKSAVSAAKEVPSSLDQSDGEDTVSTADTLGQTKHPTEIIESGTNEAQSPSSVIGYLQLYGYDTDHLNAWGQKKLPVVRLRVRVHTEMHGHTVYLIECSLTHLGRTAPAITWSTTKRLAELRSCLHDCLKSKLGSDYSKNFECTPFAHRLGPPGTTNRLNAWFQTLASCMSSGVIKPGLLAHVLEALEAPTRSSGRLSLLSSSEKL
mmetsp:Transcript_79250/g.123640  ORF Transcript_79250/g.123640 Transcript_79250/m.123640 type:complete len:217 (+) Transcript_79250:57-707(+)